MNREFVPTRLDVDAFATEAALLKGSEPAKNFERLRAELAQPDADRQIAWSAQGERRAGAAGASAPWLHLTVDARLPFVCQRCLTPVEIALRVDRLFRFVADEATAAMEDETSEEEVLSTARDFDLLTLIEDELLLELPVTPRHEVCPVPVQLSAVDPDFEEAQEAAVNPFAVLDGLRGRKKD